MTIKIYGVVDRITDGKHAVILAEQIKKEYIINIDTLDVQLREGLLVDLLLDSNYKIKQIIPNEALTRQKQREIGHVMDRLRKRKRSKFKS